MIDVTLDSDITLRLTVLHHTAQLPNRLDFRFKLMWCKDKEEETKVLSELRSFCLDKLNDNQENEK